MVLREDDTRARAARVAGRADLDSIRTVRLQAEILRDPEAATSLAYDAAPDVSVDTTETADAFTVTVDFGVTVHQHLVEGQPPEDVAKIALTLIAFYSLGSLGTEPETLADHEFQAFAESSGVFALYPYIRESIATLTARLGLPALTLPLLKTPLIEDKDQESARGVLAGD